MGLDERTHTALEALVRRYGLAERQLRQLAAVLEILEGDERAPTAVREARRALDTHIADSLVALELESVGSTGAIVDIGAGAGFPGAALAIAVPGGDFRLVESQSRKCAFLADLLRRAGLTNAHVVEARAEAWADGLGGNDLVLARALAPQPVVLEYAAPLLRLGGSLVDWRGKRSAAEETAAARAAEQLGMQPAEVRRVEPFAGARDRHLHVFVKTSATPAGFPRREGMARKRPLGG